MKLYLVLKSFASFIGDYVVKTNKQSLSSADSYSQWSNCMIAMEQVLNQVMNLTLKML